MKKGMILFFSILIVGLVAQTILNRPPPSTTTPVNQNSTSGKNNPKIDTSALIPDWSAIAAWPNNSQSTSDIPEASETTTTVDPWQITTIIVLDDSGSMKLQIDDAKAAVIQAVAQFDPQSRVGVIALNGGLVTEVVTAEEATKRLPGQLASIIADGDTPLGSRLDDAAALLANEAEARRGFGVFRILVTTDGAASDANKLKTAVSQILSETPIELATIGIGIGEGHALNVPGFTNYVSVQGVDGLAGALAAAAAEQTKFQPIDRFEE